MMLISIPGPSTDKLRNGVIIQLDKISIKFNALRKNTHYTKS